MNILITGGAGYIGSHAALHLLQQGHHVIVLDNLSRGHMAAVDILRSRAGQNGSSFTFVQGGCGDRALVESVMAGRKVEAVMHFAAFAFVGESVERPMLYYRNNVAAMAELIEACLQCGVPRFVFSSSCATYGQPDEHRVPIDESCPQAPISPYGYSKLVGERMLHEAADAAALAKKDFSFACLRYFNVAGCSLTGDLGEHHDPETHLIPITLQAALGQRKHVGIFGTDYPTPDGTCIRDYVHVDDLARAHALTLGALKPGDRRAYNLGIGKGFSVREVIDAAKRVTGKNFDVVTQPRRPGDPPRLFANPQRIQSEIGWKASVTDLDEMVRSAWTWFASHPRGYM